MASCECMVGITDLHDFFAAWYRGEEADSAVLEAALAEGFRIITPKGNELGREETIRSVVAGRGSDPTAAIRVEGRGCTMARGLHVSLYEEVQVFEDERTVRLSTALLERRDDGWLWHHVHETWMDSGA